MEPGPYSPPIFWAHVVLGIAAAVIILIPLLAQKGSRLHRKSGQIFALGMAVAAVSALYFSTLRFAPPAILSAVTALYAMGTAVLVLRERTGWRRTLQRSLPLLPWLMILFTVAMVVMAMSFDSPPEQRIFFALFGVIMVGFNLWLIWLARRFGRISAPSKLDRYRRHGLLMAVVATEVVRAPLMSFGPPFLGPNTTALYMFGPYMLIPLIYFATLPGWVKKGGRRPRRPAIDGGCLSA